MTVEKAILDFLGELELDLPRKITSANVQMTLPKDLFYRLCRNCQDMQRYGPAANGTGNPFMSSEVTIHGPTLSATVKPYPPLTVNLKPKPMKDPE